MNVEQYYVSAQFINVTQTPQQLDRLTDQIMEGLLETERQTKGVYDPGVGASLANHELDIDLMVQANSPEEAVGRFMDCVRQQLRRSGLTETQIQELIRHMSLKTHTEEIETLAAA